MSAHETGADKGTMGTVTTPRGRGGGNEGGVLTTYTMRRGTNNDDLGMATMNRGGRGRRTSQQCGNSNGDRLGEEADDDRFGAADSTATTDGTSSWRERWPEGDDDNGGGVRVVFGPQGGMAEDEDGEVIPTAATGSEPALRREGMGCRRKKTTASWAGSTRLDGEGRRSGRRCPRRSGWPRAEQRRGRGRGGRFEAEGGGGVVRRCSSRPGGMAGAALRPGERVRGAGGVRGEWRRSRVPFKGRRGTAGELAGRPWRMRNGRSSMGIKSDE